MNYTAPYNLHYIFENLVTSYCMQSELDILFSSQSQTLRWRSATRQNVTRHVTGSWLVKACNIDSKAWNFYVKIQNFPQFLLVFAWSVDAKNSAFHLGKYEKKLRHTVTRFTLRDVCHPKTCDGSRNENGMSKSDCTYAHK